MNLKYLQTMMILPDEEILLNKVVCIKGTAFHLVSLTKQEDKVVLWVVYEGCESEAVDDVLQTTYTMRSRLMKNVESSNRKDQRFIREIEIQGQTFPISSSRSSSIYYNSFQEFMHLQHFKDIGWDSKSFDDVPVTHLVIAEYEFRDLKQLPMIDASKALKLSFTLGPDMHQTYVGEKLTIAFGEKEEGNRYTFYDPFDQQEYMFFINSLKHYDMRDHWESIFDSEHMRAQPKEVIDELRKSFLESLNEECPENMDFAILEYESPDNLDLQFYSVESLDRKRELKINTSSSVSATAFIMRPDHETGINGYKAKCCIVTVIEKGFEGELEIELFSRTIQIPEERIVVEA